MLSPALQTEYARYENGHYSYRIHRSPLCEYMINFIHKLKHLPEKYMMNSVLENFTILQVCVCGCVCRWGQMCVCRCGEKVCVYRCGKAGVCWGTGDPQRKKCLLRPPRAPGDPISWVDRVAFASSPGLRLCWGKPAVCNAFRRKLRTKAVASPSPRN